MSTLTSSTPRRMLEVQLQRHFTDTWVFHARDLAKGPRTKVGAGSIWIRVIENVEELGAELNACLFKQRECLVRRHVKVDKPRGAEGPVSDIAEKSRHRLGKGARAEP